MSTFPRTRGSNSTTTTNNTQNPALVAQVFVLTKLSCVWHNCLGHPAPKVVRQVLQSCNFKFSNFENFYSTCQLAKSHCLPFVL